MPVHTSALVNKVVDILHEVMLYLFFPFLHLICQCLIYVSRMFNAYSESFMIRVIFAAGYRGKGLCRLNYIKCNGQLL